MSRRARGTAGAACLGLAFALAAAPLGAAAAPLSERHRRWIEEEVVYLASSEERREFLRLDSDAARDRFIEQFWAGRDREEHYRRLDYANRHFGRETNTPGWRTDMGRTYILLGPPQSRARFDTYSQLYPAELWFYANQTAHPALPQSFYVLFYVPDGLGEYRYYRPFLDGPLKLVRGSEFHTHRDVYRFLKPLGGDLAHAAFSLDPADPIDTQEFRPSVSSDRIVAKLQNFADDPAERARLREARRLRETVRSFFLTYQDRPLDLTTFVFTDATGQQWLDYAVWIEDQSLARGSRVRAGYRLLAPDGQLIFEDVEERAYPSSDGKFRPFLLANRIPLVPGSYRLEVEITDPEAGRAFRAERLVEVPAGGRAWLAGPLAVLAARPADAAEPDPPFRYFGAQFTPSPGRRVPTGSPLRVLFQLQVPETGPPRYQLEYVLAHNQDRQARRSWTDEVTAAELRSGRLLKSRTLSLDGLASGDYRLVVNCRPQGSPEVVASGSVAIRIVESAIDPPLYFLAGSREASRPGVAAYLRALASEAQQPADK